MHPEGEVHGRIAPLDFFQVANPVPSKQQSVFSPLFLRGLGKINTFDS